MPEERDGKLKNFNPMDVVELCALLKRHNWSLKSFGALLESADLKKYFCYGGKHEKYKAGLNQILGLYIEHQEGKLDEIRAKSVYSPERIVIDAMLTYDSMSEEGFVGDGVSLEVIEQVLEDLDRVISLYGDKLLPENKKVRDQLLRLHRGIEERAGGAV